MAASPDGHTTSPLFGLLSNTLIFRHTTPYLSVSSLLSLGASSKSFRALVYQNPDAFRYLDLSPVKCLTVGGAPLDSGGISWRSQRMDEALTEDEFYSGPLLGVFSKLHRRHVLQTVQTLILDGLTVTADLVREIIGESRFNVRILSIREAKHLNERKLMQVLRYAVRPSRPEGTPRLKGLYVFGPKDGAPKPRALAGKSSGASDDAGVMSTPGAQIGAEWNEKSAEALNTALSNSNDRWYQSSGRVITKRLDSEWAETVKACEGIIQFDAVLCRGPRHDVLSSMAWETQSVDSSDSSLYMAPAIATVALGPGGCASCSSCPEGAAVFGESPRDYLPLLSPPPLHSSTVRAAQTPSTVDGSSPPRLIVRCEGCLRGRWCQRCNKWWDEECYSVDITARSALQQQESLESVRGLHNLKKNKRIKYGVRRECFECGPTCADCILRYMRACMRCPNIYCIVDQGDSPPGTCDWCNVTPRRHRV